MHLRVRPAARPGGSFHLLPFFLRRDYPKRCTGIQPRRRDGGYTLHFEKNLRYAESRTKGEIWWGLGGGEFS